MLKRGDEIVRSYPISSSRFGIGMEEGSMKTPTGQFRVGQKIGHGMPDSTIFRSRVALEPGEPLPPTEDLVMSRILWLDGVEEHNANTLTGSFTFMAQSTKTRLGAPQVTVASACATRM